jgi:CheY-like chemotaxis protein
MNVSCIFLDINMPIMTGIQLVEKLFEMNLMNKTEIVITSSLADGNIIDQLKAKGVKYFLRKPFTPESLAKIIEILKGNS